MEDRKQPSAGPYLDADRSGDAFDATRLDPWVDPVVVRVYPGRTQTDAAALYAEEAVSLALAGYLPVAHSWAVGEPRVGRVLALGMVGAAALRPRGALVVSYVHRDAWHSPPGTAVQ